MFRKLFGSSSQTSSSAPAPNRYAYASAVAKPFSTSAKKTTKSNSKSGHSPQGPDAEANAQLNAEIQRHTLKINEQFYAALLKMLLNEVIFRLKCQAEEESRQSRGEGFQLLAEIIYYENLSKGSVAEMVVGLERFAQSKTKKYVEFCEKIESLVGVANENKDQVDLIEKVSAVNLSDDSVLLLRREQLCTFALQKKQAIEKSLLEKKEIANIESVFQKLNIIRPDGVQTERYEMLSFCSKFPAVIATSILTSEALQEVREVVPETALYTKVKGAIQLAYNVSSQNGSEISAEVLKQHVKKQSRAWSWSSVLPWNWFKPSEYQTIDRLLKASEKSVDEVACIDALRQIDRLEKKYKKREVSDKTEKTQGLNDMRLAFEAARISRFAPKLKEIFVITSEQKKLVDQVEKDKRLLQYSVCLSKAYELQADKSITEYLSEIQKRHLLPGKSDATGIIFTDEHLSDDLLELQALVYFVHQRFSVEGNAALPPLPCTWTPHNGLRITKNSYVNLVKILQPLSSFKSLYFAALIISTTLIRVGENHENYQHLLSLLEMVLTGGESLLFEVPQMKMKLSSSLQWLCSYIPYSSAKNVPSQEAIKAKLNGMFPSSESSSLNKVQSLSSSSLTATPQKNKASANAASPSSAPSGKSGSRFPFYSNSNRSSESSVATAPNAPLEVSSSELLSPVVVSALTETLKNELSFRAAARPKDKSAIQEIEATDSADKLVGKVVCDLGDIFGSGALPPCVRENLQKDIDECFDSSQAVGANGLLYLFNLVGGYCEMSLSPEPAVQQLLKDLANAKNSPGSVQELDVTIDAQRNTSKNFRRLVGIISQLCPEGRFKLTSSGPQSRMH